MRLVGKMNKTKKAGELKTTIG